MSRKPLPDEPHPLLQYGARRGWTRKRTCAFFAVPESTFKGLVTGHTVPSFARAARWEKRSKGEVDAAEVMRWHQRYQRRKAA